MVFYILRGLNPLPCCKDAKLSISNINQIFKKIIKGKKARVSGFIYFYNGIRKIDCIPAEIVKKSLNRIMF